MQWLELLLIGIGLSMDAVAVSMSNGLTLHNLRHRQALLIAAAFGMFQGLMPLLGYLAGSVFAVYISAVDHWIALVLLGIIGGKMMWESLSANEEGGLQRLTLPALLLQAVATSIDALAVGVSFAALYVSILPAVTLIAATTFAFSLVAVFVGKRFGTLLGNKAECLGGLILLLIGIKIFLEDILG